ncbi:MAG: hypothetical protein C0424_11075 [Sphingobacteriaceae bacterium]|nr:hypothetical protein [Sphingobacteriaceae bacterium]
MYKISAILLLALCSASSWAQEATTATQKHELGVNGSKIIGLLLGAEPGMQPWSIHYKQQRDKYWLRASVRYEQSRPENWITSLIEDSVLLQRFNGNDSWAIAATLGIEKRKPLGKDWSFTYGADLVLRNQQSSFFAREKRYPEYTVTTDALFGPLYSPAGSTFTSKELYNNQLRSQQVGAQVSAGFHYLINPNWALHFQVNAGMVMGFGTYRSRNYVTGEAGDSQVFVRDILPTPGFNEIAVYYRF